MRFVGETVKSRAVTMDSRGWHLQDSNLVKGMEVTRPNQVWVSNITYVTTRSGFICLSLITDVYSRRIIGWHAHSTLEGGGPLRTLYQGISMTQDGSPYDNAIAERVNGILKREWLNDEDFVDQQEAQEKVYIYTTRGYHSLPSTLTLQSMYINKKEKS